MTRLVPTVAVSALMLVVMSTDSFAKRRIAQDRVLACTGAFARDAGHESVVRTFGAKNVTYRQIQVPDGEGLKGTVAFPNNAARQIEIVWTDRKARQRPYMVTFGPAWRTAEGVTVGATLEAVEKINGGPFTLTGFDWDYGGTVADWKGAALAKQKGGCRLVVRFGIADDAPQGPSLKVSGDKEFSSRDPNMQAVKPQVREIAIMYE